MSYRGPALQYIIRKTTVNNKTGDNFSITIPRFIKQQFSGCFFRIQISGNNIILQSGTKVTAEDTLKDLNNKRFDSGVLHIFK